MVGMGRHAAARAEERAPRAARHQHRAVRPRYLRIGTALTSALTTAVALLGASGVLPAGTPPAEATLAAGRPTAVEPATMRRPDPGSTAAEQADLSIPVDSGEGRRVVFDISAQRVWLVRAGDVVVRTYLVSGSLTDNLEPGTHEVYSRSRHAVGIDDSGTMQYMVRFARGDRAAIGFHDIPVHRGARVQTREQLGTPQSHGCIRQWRPDARALWDFAPVGTTVVVRA